MNRLRRVNLSRHAAERIDAIFDSTLLRWGYQVAVEYVSLIEEAFEYLGEFAENGQPLQESELWHYLVQRRSKQFGHRIIYRIDLEDVFIIDLVHSQDPLYSIELPFSDRDWGDV